MKYAIYIAQSHPVLNKNIMSIKTGGRSWTEQSAELTLLNQTLGLEGKLNSWLLFNLLQEGLERFLSLIAPCHL